MQALAPHLQALKRLGKSAPRVEKEGDAGSKSERPLVEARIYLTGALFKMDHHPMEVSCQQHRLAATLHALSFKHV
jgi:hypothetical protein